jgi:superfamily II DNA/RNA helicase
MQLQLKPLLVLAIPFLSSPILTHSFVVPPKRTHTQKLPGSNKSTQKQSSRSNGGTNRRRSGYANRIAGVKTKRKKPPKWETEGDSLFFLVEDDNEKKDAKVGEASVKEIIENSFCNQDQTFENKAKHSSLIKPPIGDEGTTKPRPDMMMWGKCSVGPVLRSHLLSNGWETPTPIQEEVFGVLTKTTKRNEKSNAVIASPTGSGKTIAFLLPLLCTTRKSEAGSILIVTPTMGLAVQIQNVVNKLWPCQNPNLENSAMFVVPELSNTKKDFDDAELVYSLTVENMKRMKAPIIGGTSKSLIALLSGCRKDPKKSAPFQNFKTIVFDEADRLLQTESAARGEAEKIGRKQKARSPAKALILELEKFQYSLDQQSRYQKKLQLVCASATVGRTLRRQIMELTNAASIDKGATIICADDRVRKNKDSRKRSILPSTICHTYSLVEDLAVDTSRDDSEKILESVWRTMEVLLPAPIIVFPGKLGVQTMVAYFERNDFQEVRTLRDRTHLSEHENSSKGNYSDWKNVPIYVVGEKFARGLDIEEVRYVIMASPPNSPAAYTHLAGRTGRGGKSGTSITLVKDVKDARRIAALSEILGIPFLPLPEVFNSNGKCRAEQNAVTPGLITSIPAVDYEKFTVIELKQKLKALNERVSGRKAELIERLKSAHESSEQ